jgi:hypothetical protein
MIDIFKKYPYETSILDDFVFYEKKQENVMNKQSLEDNIYENPLNKQIRNENRQLMQGNYLNNIILGNDNLSKYNSGIHANNNMMANEMLMENMSQNMMGNTPMNNMSNINPMKNTNMTNAPKVNIHSNQIPQYIPKNMNIHQLTNNLPMNMQFPYKFPNQKSLKRVNSTDNISKK